MRKRQQAGTSNELIQQPEHEPEHDTPESNCPYPVNTKHLYDFMQRRPNVEDVGPTLYKCYTNVLCLLGRPSVPSRLVARAHFLV